MDDGGNFSEMAIAELLAMPSLVPHADGYYLLLGTVSYEAMSKILPALPYGSEEAARAMVALVQPSLAPEGWQGPVFHRMNPERELVYIFAEEDVPHA